ncbi:hypothetical protein [Parvicella tangerina]|uniref:Uncharacterized protein n=1 Tax=Parvicella tangerina TaxID=2829795 RepID=A0A916JNQ4_9FLAO|nr:hypothetical protein [Parvicella tangerina]CAG5084191.1 hypothetical protein CRYO30217_02401 [Parvicella tangerina]
MFKPSEEIHIKAAYTLSTNLKHKHAKKWIASNGEALVSKQELQIYEYLLEQEGLHVEYEKAFQGTDRLVFPDFTIVNLITHKEYIWEHFGMTNNDNYLNEIPKKLSWFNSQELRSIENGGRLIITYYREDSFFKEVAKFVDLIKKI